MTELPVTVMGDKMHTMETARTTETGLTSSRVSILVTVGIRVVVSSPARVVDGNGVSVTWPSVDIVALAAMESSALFLAYAVFFRSGSVHRCVFLRTTSWCEVFQAARSHQESPTIRNRIARSLKWSVGPILSHSVVNKWCLSEEINSFN